MKIRRCAAAALLAAQALLWPTQGMTEPVPPREVRVVDGDTIVFRGTTYRLVGFDAPETGQRAKCSSEVALGHRATAFLKEIVTAGELDLERVACSCRSGTEGTRFCNYGRRCAILRSHDQDVAEIMIVDRLAHPLRCSKTRCPPLKPWCS